MKIDPPQNQPGSRLPNWLDRLASCVRTERAPAAHGTTTRYRAHALIDAAPSAPDRVTIDADMFSTSSDIGSAYGALRVALDSGKSLLGPAFDTADYHASQARADHTPHTADTADTLKRAPYEAIMGLLLEQTRAFMEKTGASHLQACLAVQTVLAQQRAVEDRTAAFKGIATVYMGQIIRAEEVKAQLLQTLARLPESDKAPLRGLVSRQGAVEKSTTDRQIADNLFRLLIAPRDVHRCDRGATALPDAQYVNDITQPGYLAGALKALNRILGHLPDRLDARFIGQLHNDLFTGTAQSVPCASNEPAPTGLRHKTFAVHGLPRGKDLSAAGADELRQLDPAFSYALEVAHINASDKEHYMVLAQPVSSKEIKTRMDDLLAQYRAVTSRPRLPAAAHDLADAALCSAIVRLSPFNEGNESVARLLLYALQKQRGENFSPINPDRFRGYSAQEVAYAIKINRLGVPATQAPSPVPRPSSAAQRIQAPASR